jgi:hypothetical protein
MPPIVLSESEYRDKVHACWLGKNIGGTLGAPVEAGEVTHRFTCPNGVGKGVARQTFRQEIAEGRAN